MIQYSIPDGNLSYDAGFYNKKYSQERIVQATNYMTIIPSFLYNKNIKTFIQSLGFEIISEDKEINIDPGKLPHTNIILSKRNL